MNYHKVQHMDHLEYDLMNKIVRDKDLRRIICKISLRKYRDREINEIIEKIGYDPYIISRYLMHERKKFEILDEYHVSHKRLNQDELMHIIESFEFFYEDV